MQFAATRDGMRGQNLIIRAPDLLVEPDLRPATQTAPLSVLVENAADKKRVVTNVRPKQKRLLWIRAPQRNEQVRNVLLRAIIHLIRDLQLTGARERLEQRRHVIAKL